MRGMLARSGRAGATLAAALILAGCHFAVVPPKHTASPRASAGASMADPYGARAADAPALMVQCAVDQAGLRPDTGQDWFSHGQVSINTTNASNFTTWWSGHSRPGPYPQTFTIAGHRTHYLEFGTSWVKQGGLWVPVHTGNTNPQALQYSLIAWANWTAANDKLPPLVCGTSVTARQLQDQVYGSSTANPW
jgi:hypothetical protein